jgi:predicted outer membrane repeat protein
MSDQSILAGRRDRRNAICNSSLNQQHKALPRLPLQKSSKRLLAGLLLLPLIGQAPAFAATIVVGGQCTLARAIVSANNDASPRAFCRPGRGADTIVLPRHRPQVLAEVDNVNYGPTGLPTVRSPINIIGNGNTISRHPRAAPFRIFSVAPNGSLTLSRLTVKGGLAPQLGGGGARSLGRLIMVDVVFDGNRAYGNGGGFWGQNIVVSIRNRFVRNGSFCFPRSSRALCNGGGGFYATGLPPPGATTVPHLAVEGATFVGNAAGEDGGGLQISGEATVNNSVFADNTAAQGGAIAVGDEMSSLALTNTTLTDNIARQGGGGIVAGAGSNITLTHTVVSGNTAPHAPEALVEPSSFVDTDAFNTFGQAGNAGVVRFTPGVTDTVAAQPPPDLTPGVPPAPPIARLTPPSVPPPVNQPLPTTIVHRTTNPLIVRWVDKTDRKDGIDGRGIQVGDTNDVVMFARPSVDPDPAARANFPRNLESTVVWQEGVPSCPCPQVSKNFTEAQRHACALTCKGRSQAYLFMFNGARNGDDPNLDRMPDLAAAGTGASASKRAASTKWYALSVRIPSRCWTTDSIGVDKLQIMETHQKNPTGKVPFEIITDGRMIQMKTRESSNGLATSTPLVSDLRLDTWYHIMVRITASSNKNQGRYIVYVNGADPSHKQVDSIQRTYYGAGPMYMKIGIYKPDWAYQDVTVKSFSLYYRAVVQAEGSATPDQVYAALLRTSW